MDITERFNKIKQVSNNLSSLSGFYQNKCAYDEEQLKEQLNIINKVRNEVLNLLTICENDVKELNNFSDKTFKGKLNNIALTFKDFGNNEGQDGCVDSAFYFLDCMSSVIDYRDNPNEVNAELMFSAINENIDILKNIKSLPRNLTDLSCFIKLTEKVDEPLKKSEMLFKFMQTCINSKGTLIFWFDCCGDTVDIALRCCQRIKYLYPHVIFKLAVLNESFNRRWTAQQLGTFGDLLKLLDCVQSTDNLETTGAVNNVDAKNRFLMHSCKINCFVTKDKSNNFIDECRNNGRMVFILDESVVRYR